jgi:hypothetical protein
MSARGEASYHRFVEPRAYDSPPADWMEDEADIDLRLADMIWATPIPQPSHERKRT